MTVHASAETAAVLLFAGAATVSGLRSVMVRAGASTVSADTLALAGWLTAGVAAGAAVVLVGELLARCAGGSPRQRAVRRLPVWFCLVAVVALGAVAGGGGLVDEPVLTLVLSAQFAMIATALVPSALTAEAT